MTTIQTTTYEEALAKALELGFETAQIYGMTTSLEEMLEDCRNEPTGESPADWFIVGDILCRAGDLWRRDAEVYFLE